MKKSLALGLLAALPPVVGEAGAFRVGVAKVDITPDTPQMLRGYGPRRSTAVHDRLYHRVVVLDDGATVFTIISSDLCSLCPAYSERVVGDLARQLSLRPEHVWWTITHTHSAPYVGPSGVPGVLMPNRFRFTVDEAYGAHVERAMSAAVREALERRAPARLGVGWGEAEANINRRERRADGQVKLGRNPDGPVDRRLGVIRLETPDGTPLALIANYAMHATVLGNRSTLVSADAPGVVADYVERAIGVPLLFLNGAAGNLAPIYSTLDASAGVERLKEFETLLGDPILEVNRRMRDVTAAVRLRPSRIVVETPKRTDLPWSQELGAFLRVTETGEELLRLPVRFLRVNDDLVLWSAPLELFCEIEMQIRERSPFAHTLFVGYTNGQFTYLSTEKEYQAGGYEVATTPFTASAARDLTQAVGRQLDEMGGDVLGPDDGT